MELLGSVVGIVLANGCLYGLVGLAFTAIYNVSRLINFAQGEFLMLGGVGAWLAVSVWGLPWPIGLGLVILVVGVVGVGVERMASPLIKRGAPMFTVAIVTLGCSQMILGVVGPVTNYDWLTVAPFLGAKLLPLPGIAILPQQALLVGVTLVLCLAYWFFLRRTWLGKALRAIGFDREMANLVGIKSQAMTVVAFIISASMAAIAGFLVAPLFSPFALMGFPLLVKGFIAATVGGLGNPFAALVGGLFIAAVGGIVTAYLSSALADVSIFAMLIVILLIRPEGILPEQE